MDKFFSTFFSRNFLRGKKKKFFLVLLNSLAKFIIKYLRFINLLVVFNNKIWKSEKIKNSKKWENWKPGKRFCSLFKSKIFLNPQTPKLPKPQLLSSPNLKTENYNISWILFFSNQFCIMKILVHGLLPEICEGNRNWWGFYSDFFYQISYLWGICLIKTLMIWERFC